MECDLAGWFVIAFLALLGVAFFALAGVEIWETWRGRKRS